MLRLRHAPVTGRWLPDGTFELAAGHHRVEAVRLLGHATIEANVFAYDDNELWSVGEAENGSQRGEVMGAALCSTAGLIKLVAGHHFNDRDKELGELVGEVRGELQFNPSRTASFQIKTAIEKGTGIGMPTILGIIQRRRKMHAKPGEADKSDTRGLHAIREAIASLKASGEHDRIIAGVASEAAARRCRSGDWCYHGNTFGPLCHLRR